MPSVLPAGIVVTITGANIPAGSSVVDLQSGSPVPLVANVSTGAASLTLRSNGTDIAVFGQPSAASAPTAPAPTTSSSPSSPTTPGSTIVGATTAQTGKPFIGEGIVAGLLIVGGIGLAVGAGSPRLVRRRIRG